MGARRPERRENRIKTVGGLRLSGLSDRTQSKIQP